jgi:type I restriction enzyme, R subunit
MSDTTEARALQNVDQLLTNAGWVVQSRDETNITAARGVAIREFPLKSGYGEADYLLYVDAIPAGVVEAKKEGETLTSFEIQRWPSRRVETLSKAAAIPLPKHRRRNPLHQSARTRRSQPPSLLLHRPETFAAWLPEETKFPGSILRARLPGPRAGSTAARVSSHVSATVRGQGGQGGNSKMMA